MRHGLERIAVVVGDAALMSGLSLEALNDIGQRQTQMLIVRQRQRDVDQPDRRGVLEVPRRRSSCRARGARARAPTTARSSASRSSGRTSSSGRAACARRSSASPSPASCSRTSASPTSASCPGHDLHALLETLGAALALPGPTIVHVRTQKGRGYRPATRTRSVPRRGAAADGADADGRTPTTAPRRPPPAGCRPSRWPTTRRRRPSRAGRAEEAPELHRGLRRRADRARPATDRRIVGITAGMPTGTGHVASSAEFPDRVFDVGIAEQHAMTLRDRARDGRDAAGRRALFDVPAARLRPDRPRRLPERPAGGDRGRPGGPRRRGRDQPPGHVHAAGPAPAARTSSSPRRSDEQELRSMVRTAFAQDHPFALHYPRDAGFGLAPVDPVGPPDRPRRGPPRGPRPAVRRASGRSWPARWRPPTSSRPRAGPSASSTPGSPSRSTAS